MGFQGAEDPGLVVLMVLMLMVILVGWESGVMVGFSSGYA